ncbi:porin [Paraburkholderia tropica]|uniref:porin n=1 Tax=Paraburkholderia tropica TaxID=92647 RepID=UPI002AB66D5A|nr:porin [Paraburkholderia tropica]
MKKVITLSSGTAIIFGAIALQSAHAQTSVTLYGVIDEALRFTTHQNTGSGSKSQLGLSEGAFNGPRWGLRMSEDLGGGNKAFALLESGFNLNTGKSDQQGQLFGRQLYMGFSNPTWGALRAGRQYGTLYSLMATVDPLGTANIPELDWPSFFTGLRYDNTLDYQNKLGPMNVEVQYSFGNQAGSTSIGRTLGASLWYGTPALTAGVAGQQSRDAVNHKAQLAMIVGKGSYGPLSLYGYYGHSTKDAGFRIGTSGTTDPLANTSLASNYNTVAGTGTQTAGRIDNLFVLATSYKFTSTLNVIGGWMLDLAQGVAGADSGRTQTYYATVVYSLSKRTDIYAEVDYDRLSGAAKTDVNGLLAGFGGANTRVGAIGGLRVRF